MPAHASPIPAATGAPLLALHKLDRRFGATHTLKVVIGKWLNHGAKLFIFDEPTVGVDVGAKAEIYWLLASLLRKGAGVIMISSYLPEVYEFADMLHVFRAGAIAASHGRKDASQETMLTEAIGV
jgi:ribose transport system ATP-binding protein